MDKLTPERRSANMSRIRSRHTSPEMIVRRLVHGMGYRYRLHVASLPGKPDIVLPRLKKIIEVRGCFWHQHPGCTDSHIPKSRIQYWEPKLARNQRRDEDNGRKLRKLGWKVCLVWECETKVTRKLLRRLHRFLGTRPAICG
jgi:DNA mismatch endonuclease (patch repair protein)